MSEITWPFKRIEYNGMNNPRYVTDIVSANEAVLDAIKSLSGLTDVDFAIISGLAYTIGSPNTYQPGIFYLNGDFYIMEDSFTENLYLAPGVTELLPQPFEDGNNRTTYKVYYAVTTSNSSGSTPQFTGNMDSYRIGNWKLKSDITTLQGVMATLKSAAFLEVGSTAGTVMAGDYTYSKATLDSSFANKADKSNVLLKDNTTAYTPAGDYNPATKLYADQAQGFKLLWLGDFSGDGQTINKRTGSLTITADHIGTGRFRINHNLGSLKYFVHGIGLGSESLFADPRVIYNQTAISFEVIVSDDASANDSSFQLSIFQYF